MKFGETKLRGACYYRYGTGPRYAKFFAPAFLSENVFDQLDRHPQGYFWKLTGMPVQWYKALTGRPDKADAPLAQKLTRQQINAYSRKYDYRRAD